MPFLQLVEQDALHNASFFLLLEIQASVSQSHVFETVFQRSVDAALSFDVEAFGMPGRKRFFEEVEMLLDGSLVMAIPFCKSCKTA